MSSIVHDVISGKRQASLALAASLHADTVSPAPQRTAACSWSHAWVAWARPLHAKRLFKHARLESG